MNLTYTFAADGPLFGPPPADLAETIARGRARDLWKRARRPVRVFDADTGFDVGMVNQFGRWVRPNQEV